MLAALRNGEWITGERLRVYSRILLAFSAFSVIWVIATADGDMSANNQPLGTDFSQVWVAGKEVLAGRPEAPFDIRLHAQAQRAAFGPETAIFGWHYPPYFLAAAALLARLPYLQALALWQLATLALYLLTIRAILRGAGLPPRKIMLAALAFPAVVVNVLHGQNGFLTAALLGGGFLLLDRRPLIAGALFGLLAYKPQFLLTLPLALLVLGQGRALLAAATTLSLMTAASIVAFGVSSWRAFIDSFAFTRTIVEEGATGFEKIQSVFAAVRLLGGGVEAAWLCQTVTAGCALGGLFLLLRSGADARVKAAGTITAMFLTTPYALDYDMMALAPALALLLSHGLEEGFRPYEKSVLVVAFMAPLVARPMAALLCLPVGVAAVALLCLSTLCYMFNKIKQDSGATTQNASDRREPGNDDNAGQIGRGALTPTAPKVNFL
jgi:alpha-1,2-mannosyltransferase